MTPQQVKATAALIRKQRSTWLELEDGKSVLVERPGELQLKEMMVFEADGKLKTIEVELPQVERFVTDWKGFLESDLIGGAGGSEPVPFHSELWAEVIIDKAVWHRKIAQQIVEMIGAHLLKEAEQAKN